MTQRERVLKMLEDAGRNGVTTGDFLAARLPRFSARIMELRSAGHNVATERVRDGEWRYTLTVVSGPQGLPSGVTEPPEERREDAVSGALFSMPEAEHKPLSAATTDWEDAA